MIDVFNIDRESDGFRKNTLDWRKLHTNYTKLSESKLKRGIKPLPLNLLLKLFGPQKILSTYVVSRQVSNAADYYSIGSSVTDSLAVPVLDMKDKAVTKTLTFPDGAVLLSSSTTEETGALPNHSLVRPAKHAALPARPVFQRSAHVPGRYFPKPTMEDLSLPHRPPPDGATDKPRTRTPRSAHAPQTSARARDEASRAGMSTRASATRNSGLMRGCICRPTDSARSHKTSSKATANTKPNAAITFDPPTTAYEPPRAQTGPAATGDKLDVFAISFRNEEHEGGQVGDSYDPNSELHSDYYTIKRLRMNTRHVTFPRSSTDFTTVLHGRTKTIHPRDMSEVLDAHLTSTVQRSRTHVGFADTDVT